MTTMIVDELGRIPMSPFLTATLTRAADYAGLQAHPEVTLEHLLLALAEDPEASVVLKSSNIDIARLTSDVSVYLGRIEDRLADGRQGVVLSGDLRRVLEAAAAAASQGRRREINGAIVLAAIVGDGRSPAAHMLRAQGLTFEEAIRALQRATNTSPAPAAPSPAAPASMPALPPAGPSGAEDILATARERVATRRTQGAPGVSNDESRNPGAASTGAMVPSPSPFARENVETGGSPSAPLDSRTVKSMEPRWEPAASLAAPVAAPPQSQPQTNWAPSPQPAPSAQPPRPQRIPPPIPPEAAVPRGPYQGAGAPPPGTLQPNSPQQAPGAYRPAPPQAPQTQPPWSDPGMARQRTGAPSPDLARGMPGMAAGGRVRVETGRLVENIPRKMRVAVAQLVEVRIAKESIKGLADGLQGGGAAYPHRIMVTKAMSVRLRAPDGGFWIESASPDTQWIENMLGTLADDFASWRWTITPKERGKRRLQIIISARTMGDDGVVAETAFPDQVIEVRVATNFARTAKRWTGWIAAAVLGGLLARFGEGAFDIGSAFVAKLMSG